MNNEEKTSALYAVIGRAIADTDFRDKLMNHTSQAAALEEYGLPWDTDVRKAFDKAKGSIHDLNTPFGLESTAS